MNVATMPPAPADVTDDEAAWFRQQCERRRRYELLVSTFPIEYPDQIKWSCTTAEERANAYAVLAGHGMAATATTARTKAVATAPPVAADPDELGHELTQQIVRAWDASQARRERAEVERATAAIAAADLALQRDVARDREDAAAKAARLAEADARLARRIEAHRLDCAARGYWSPYSGPW